MINGIGGLMLWFISMATYSPGEPNSAPLLRDGPPGLLRTNARQALRAPEEARCFRAVSKDQGERIRERNYEMLH